MIRILLLYTFFALNVQISQASTSEPAMLSLEEMRQLSDSQKKEYLNNVAKALAVIPESEKESSYFSYIWNLLDFSKKPARGIASQGQEYRCIAGGVPQPLDPQYADNPSEQNCGMNSYAGETCSGGQEICNPCLFGMKPSGDPVCYGNATTKRCYETTKPGVVENFHPSMTEGGGNECQDFVDTINKLCPESGGPSVVKVHETKERFRESACDKVWDQTRINRDRLSEGDGELNVVISTKSVNPATIDNSGHDLSAGDVERQAYNQRLVKMNEAAGLGLCLPAEQPSNVNDLFERNNVTPYLGRVYENPRSASNQRQMTNYSDGRVTALSRVVAAYDRIGGGALTALKDGGEIQVVFDDDPSNWGNSRRYGSQIQLRRGSQNMAGTGGESEYGGLDNIGLLAHEVAHYIGGANNRELYSKYRQHMGSSVCSVSNYCNHKHSGESYPLAEQFAEVVAAYVTMPHAFKGKGAACRKAFDFMKDLFNEPNMTMSCEARRNSYSVSSAVERSLVPRARPEGDEEEESQNIF